MASAIHATDLLQRHRCSLRSGFLRLHNAYIKQSYHVCANLRTNLLQSTPILISKYNPIVLETPLVYLIEYRSWHSGQTQRPPCKRTKAVFKSGKASLECSCEPSELTPFFTSKNFCVSKLISATVACASSEFCKSSRKTVNSPEYRARILSIKAR